MQQSPNRFRKTTIDTLAKRAAYLCSNPFCKVSTTGPASDINSFITIGESAHIHGAEESSARYIPSMTPAERADISNGIWLCRNCHKMVDSDVDKYPADLLRKWKNEHEEQIAGNLHANLKIEKSAGWEYQLAAKLLHEKLTPIITRWQQLTEGLYASSMTPISKKESLSWIEHRLHSLKGQVYVLNLIINKKFVEAFGISGVHGSATAIAATCDLFAEASQQLLEWEESVQFTSVDKSYRKLSDLLKGIGLHIFQQFVALPAALTSGTTIIDITISLPKGWMERFSRELIS